MAVDRRSRHPGRVAVPYPRAVLSALVVGALALAMSGCSASSSNPAPSGVHGDAVPVVSNLGPTSFTGPGPFAAGETTFVLERGGPKVEAWYPATKASVKGRPEASYNVADWLPPAVKKLIPAHFTGAVYKTGAYRGVPVAPGRFPLVVFTHGYAGFRDQSTFLTARLATWGFVVAAPDLPDNDLTAVLDGHTDSGIAKDVLEQQGTIDVMATKNTDHTSMFAGHLDMVRVAAIGHSLGGAISEGLAAVDPRVKTFIGLAGATVGSFGQSASGPGSTVPKKPGMLMVGTADQVVDPSGIAHAFTLMTTPKRLVTLQNFGHLLFADICQIAPGQGGLLALANQVHVTIPASLRKLATDGCLAPDAPVTSGWPAVRQAVTAQLRYVLGFDKTLAGLNGLQAAFPGVVARNTYVSS